MVTLYVGGQKIGTWAESEKLFTELAAKRQVMEVRDEAGNPIATITPAEAPLPDEPLIPWEPDVTWEELERRKAEPGFTIEEARKKFLSVGPARRH